MKEFKKYANSFQEKSKLGLESIGMLLEKLGNPHKDGKFVHVAGTNGKGSVCAFVQNILTSAGFKTGKFISPNMIEVYERISINGENISPNDMDRLLSLVGEKAEEMEKEIGVMPTQFEIWTAAAFLYFKEKKCDIVVLETGLGGRLDATNIIDNPICSVITRVDMDHTEYLGDTIEKITFEKAGIIKENCTVITLCDQAALNVIITKAKETKSEVLLADRAENIENCGGRECFDYKNLKKLEINISKPIPIRIIPPSISALFPSLVPNFLPICTAIKLIINVSTAIIVAQMIASKTVYSAIVNPTDKASIDVAIA